MSQCAEMQWGQKSHHTASESACLVKTDNLNFASSFQHVHSMHCDALPPQTPPVTAPTKHHDGGDPGRGGMYEYVTHSLDDVPSRGVGMKPSICSKVYGTKEELYHESIQVHLETSLQISCTQVCCDHRDKADSKLACFRAHSTDSNCRRE